MQGGTDGEVEIETGRGTVTGIETETEIEEDEDMEVAVVPVAAAGADHAVVVVGAMTGVAAEAVAETGADTEQKGEVPETDEMIDQASWMINQRCLSRWHC